MSQTNAVRKAYIDPIRTVLLVDDRFPNYSDIVSSLNGDGVQPRKDRWETRTAELLWNSFRERNWLCDIENRHVDSKVHDRIDKADLIILDYHLDGDNPVHALRLLRHLAESGHSHLVILYTKDANLKAVRRTVAAYLRGSRIPESILAGNDAILGIWDEMTEHPPIEDELLDEYIAAGKWKGAPAAKRLYETLTVAPSKKDQILLAEALLEYQVRVIGQSVNYSGVPIRISEVGVEPPWITQGNLFVTLVQKQEQGKEGDRIIAALENGLRNFAPDQLRLTLSYTRHAIQKGGFSFDDRVLTNRARLAAWWLQMLSGTSKEQELQTLCLRLLEGMTETILSEVKEFADGLEDISCPAGVEPLDHARRLARLDGGNKFDVFHELNEFLCSTPYKESHIRTGTVFCKADEASNPSWVWICVTPSCDLVPRTPTESDPWRRELDPIRPMLALRAEVFALSETDLHDATHGNQIFITVNNKRLVLKIPHATTRQHRPEMLLLLDQGKTTNSQFEAYRIINQKAGSDGANKKVTPDLAPTLFRALAQIRKQYASRLLHESGAHLSRIGVDFVNSPKPPPAKKT